MVYDSNEFEKVFLQDWKVEFAQLVYIIYSRTWNYNSWVDYTVQTSWAKMVTMVDCATTLQTPTISPTYFKQEDRTKTLAQNSVSIKH